MSYELREAIRECVRTTTDGYYCAEYAEKELARLSKGLSRAAIQSAVSAYANAYKQGPEFEVKNKALQKRWQPALDLWKGRKLQSTAGIF